MVLIPLILVFIGLSIVTISADQAIKHFLHFSRYFKISEFAISFIIAGIAAVLPELSIGVVAAFQGASSLGFGLILGSNVADLTLVVGIVVLFAGNLKLDAVAIKNTRRAILAVILPVLLFLDGEISRLDGVILLGAFIIYAIILLRTKREGEGINGRKGKLRLAMETAVLFTSLAALLVGGSLVTRGSEELSVLLGLPLFVIGVVVAIGTCLPEMTFALKASRKKHGELGFGNILGNVLADSMMTIGIIAIIQPIKPQYPVIALAAGLFVIFSALLVVILCRKGELNRKDGALLIVCYAVFLAAESTVEKLVVA